MSRPPSEGGRSLTRAWAVFAALVVALDVALWSLIPDHGLRGRLALVLELVKSAAVTALLYYAAYRARPSGRTLHPAWAALGTAYLAYTAGDFLTAVLGTTLTTHGALSLLMNAFYLAFFPLFLLGVLWLPKAPLSRVERGRLLLDMAIVTLAAGTVLWTILVGPFADRPEVTPAALLLTLAYPLGDLALLWAVMTLLFRHGDPAADRGFRLLALSAAILIVTDTAYSHQILAGDDSLADWLSLGYILSHLTAGFAAALKAGSPEASAQAGRAEAVRPPLVGVSLLLAYSGLLAAWLTTQAAPGVQPSPLGSLAVLLMIGLAFLRQVLDLREMNRLNRRLEESRGALEDKVAERTSELARTNRELADEVDQRRRAETALQASEERFRALVQNSYDMVTVHDTEGRVVYESPSVARLLGFGPDGLLGRTPFECVHPDDIPVVREAFQRVSDRTNSGIPTVYRFRHADGHYLHVETLGNNLLEHPAIRGIVLTSRDVTERMRSEEALVRRVKDLTVLNAVATLAAEALDEGILLAEATEVIRDGLFPDNCGVLLVEASRGVLTHAPSYHARDLRAPLRSVPLGRGVTGKVAASGTPRRVEDTMKDPDYIAIDSTMRSEICAPLRVGTRILGVLDAESAQPGAFTERDLETLTTLAGLLATAIGRLRAGAEVRESEDRFRRLSEAAFEGVCISDKGRLLDANQRMAEMLGYSLPEIVGKDLLEFIAPEHRSAAAAYLEASSEGPVELLSIRRDGSTFPVECRARPLPYQGRTVRVTAVRDITRRKQSEARIQLQLRRLSALRSIDAAISSSLDLRSTLHLFLDHTISQLEVDAAAVLLLNPSTQTLEFAASRGFRTDALRHSHIPLGECFAGRAAIERKPIHVGDLKASPESFARSPLLLSEEFRAYFAVPLIARGQVKGVLEVFHRAYLSPDREWQEFLETLAGQGAIAVENMALFEGLQKSNLELSLAYDTTLEGWSKALELRDQETQGHTRRVAEMTLRLSRSLGVAEADLAHVRRGALLHDIGKMGIPDGILLKPGPLTDPEWEIMKRHVTYAHELLSPIEFLKPALDIPYGHHERWDGGGYPRGLKGEEIPLPARIFAVVDAWDALTSDRPYRKAWGRERVRAYLREEAGVRFDPRIVDVFLTMESETPSPAE
jgi:PAS domain S-box-containing protein/putative nucleotidyltransferase with HDIG domain